MAKLHWLDAPTKIENSGGVVVQTDEQKRDYSTFSQDELLIYIALARKAEGDQNWDEGLRSLRDPLMAKTHGEERLAVAFVLATIT